MPMKLAKTTYDAGPDDSLLVKDVYEATSSAVVNSYQKQDSGLGDAVDRIPSMNMSSLLGKIKQALDKLKNSLSDKNGSQSDSSTNTPSSSPNVLTPGGAASAAINGINNLASISNLGSSGTLGAMSNNSAVRNQVANVFGSMGGLSTTVSNVNRGTKVTTTAPGLSSAISGNLGNALGGETAAFAGIANNILNRNTLVKNDNKKTYNDFDTKVGATSLENIANNISDGNLEVLASLSDLPKTFHSDLNGGMIDSQITGNVIAKVGDAITQLNPKDSSAAAAPIVNIVNAITDDKYEAKVVNKGSAAALISATTFIANKLNMPNVFSTIASAVEDESILIEAAKPLLQRALETGDFKTIEDIADTKVAKSIKNIVPAAAETILSKIITPVNLAQQEYSKYYQSIRETLDSIDIDWALYRRGDEKIINAGQLGNNFYIVDLIRSQLNELMSPRTYLSNIQRVYGENVPFDTDVTNALAALVNSVESITTSGVVNTDNIVVTDIDFTEIGDAVNPASDSIKVGTGEDMKVTSFANEPYLLLAGMYLEDTVDECLQRDFPEWYSGLEDKPILSTNY